MISQRKITAFALLSLLVVTQGESANGAEELAPALPKSAVVDLCSALEAIQPGDRLRVVVEGIYQNGRLFDPWDPYCNGQVQPVTQIELAPGVAEPPEFSDLVKKDHRVFAQFVGILEARRKSNPDNPDLAPALAYVNRVYGLSGRFRTKLVVSGIDNIWPAEHAEQGTPRWRREARSPLPVVRSAQLPTAYPWMAENTGAQGDVVVEVDLKMGNVVSTQVISAADRLLIEDTIANIKTWIFDPEAEATFTTTFSYRFEDDLPPTTAAVRVRTELPVKVEILAPRSKW